MTDPTAGYDGPSTPKEKESSPSEQEWKIEQARMLGDDAVIVRMMLDGEPVGMLRLPSLEHLRFLRERIQES